MDEEKNRDFRQSFLQIYRSLLHVSPPDIARFVRSRTENEFLQRKRSPGSKRRIC